MRRHGRQPLFVVPEPGWGRRLVRSFSGVLRPLGATVLLEGWSVEVRLAAIVLALAVPLNLIILAVIWHLIESASDVQRVGLLHTSRSVAAAVDAQLDKHMTLALALARSPQLPRSAMAFRATRP
jgi:hypothetical protein